MKVLQIQDLVSSHIHESFPFSDSDTLTSLDLLFKPPNMQDSTTIALIFPR